MYVVLLPLYAEAVLLLLCAVPYVLSLCAVLLSLYVVRAFVISCCALFVII